MVKGVRIMNFHESADRDFSIQFCEYNYSNPDYDQIYCPNEAETICFAFKTPMKVYLDKISISGENACILCPWHEQHYKAVQADSGTATFIFPVCDLKNSMGSHLTLFFIL